MNLQRDLDPQGMKEIRELISYLSKEKQKTILLSSHILYEVELVATRMIIINKGNKVIEGTVRELLDTNNMQVTLEVDDVEKAKANFCDAWYCQCNSIGRRKFFDIAIR